jgi:hypothetical protein
MAGADIAVTDARIADLMLEYAKLLGRAGTTDTVRIPVARNKHAEQADLLIGPASQIALTENDEPRLEKVKLKGVDEVVADLRTRIEGLTGQRHGVITDEDSDAPAFVDFDEFSG